MQIPILSGIYSNESSDFRTSYPRNLIPVPKSNGIAEGYLRPAYGLVELGSTSGIGRGGINWNGSCYRVMGTKLVKISAIGTETVLGDVGAGGTVSMDYSFDRLAIVSGGRLYYWNGSALTQVTDPDLGQPISVRWADGYFVMTDGFFIIVSELLDPTSIDALKYGSAEVDPDRIKAILKIRTEIYAPNRYTIEVFENVGGTGFPYARIEGAQVTRGTYGTHTACILNDGSSDGIAFLGSGRNEPPSVWYTKSSTTVNFATREIEQILKGYSESELSACLVENVTIDKNNLLMIHLPDQTLVYDVAASLATKSPIWFTLTSSITGLGQYRARGFVWCYDKWLIEDPQSARVGTISDTISSHYGQVNGWEFGTNIVYNNGMGAIFHELELVCLSGRVDISADPVVWASYSLDGVVFSQEKAKKTGRFGQRNTRINWLSNGSMKHWRLQKFRGTSDSHLAIARLEARLEPLNA